VDARAAGKTPLITPDPKRRALSVKEIATPTTAPRGASNENPPNALRARSAKPNAEDGIGLGISRVFTPKPTKDVFVAPERDILSPVAPTQPKANSSPVEEESNPVPAPFRVFSRPTPHAENAFIPKRTAAFTPLVEPTSKVENPPPAPSFAPSFVFTERAMSKTPVFSSDSEREDQLSPDQEYEGEEAPDASSPSEEVPLDYDDYYEEDPGLDHEPQHIPFGGRFGQFNVMTPITERTFEMTASTRFLDTPRDHSPYLRHEHGAILAAERLAAELREEEEREQALSRRRDSLDEQDLRTTDGESCFAPDNDEHPALPAMDSIEEKIGSLSLVDALSLKSSFKPPNPCNPFDPPIVKTLLSLVLTDGGYHNLMDREVHHLEDLRKFAHKRRKMSGNTSATLVLDPDQTFPLTLAGRRFEVGTKLGEGAFGSVFAARDSAGKGSRCNNDSDDEEDDEDASAMVALKVVRPRNLWEYHVLRRLHASIPSHLRRSVVIPYDLYAYRDESFLVLELSPQGTLLDIVNRAVEAGVSQQGACLDEMLVTFFTIELLRLLEGMHSLGFIHGDLKIDNCLVRLEGVPGGSAAWSNVYQPSGQGGWSYKGVKVIDFGRTIDTRLFPRGQTFIAEWEVDARDCPEMREDRPWTFQPDYFGLAGIVYCMLFGKYLENSSITKTTGADGRFKIATALKRYWQTEMWTKLFDILLNPLLIRPGGDMPLCDELRQVRGEMEKWLEANSNRVANTLKSLLKKIERAML
jgi:checkpoint serine/threonine-protein kinase